MPSFPCATLASNFIPDYLYLHLYFKHQQSFWQLFGCPGAWYQFSISMCAFRTFVLCSRSSWLGHTWRERRACGRISLHVRTKYSLCRYVHDMQLQSHGLASSSTARPDNHVIHLVAEYHHVRRDDSVLRGRAEEVFIIVLKSEFWITVQWDIFPQCNSNEFSYHGMGKTNSRITREKLALIHYISICGSIGIIYNLDPFTHSSIQGIHNSVVYLIGLGAFAWETAVNEH
jgi:hypothetical protein